MMTFKFWEKLFCTTFEYSILTIFGNIKLWLGRGDEQLQNILGRKIKTMFCGKKMFMLPIN